MTALSPPDVGLHRSWLAAVDEFGDVPVNGSGLWDLGAADRRALDASGFADLVAHLRAQADPATTMPRGRVHCDFLWITDGDPGPTRREVEVVGFLALRHRLTPWLLEEGGHIGYAVRPSRRREGHASRALSLAVPRAARLGLDRVLVTCDETNAASARTIERCGGVLEDVRGIKRRYWIEVPSD